MKLVLTPTVNGTKFCLLESYFNGKECGRGKLERAHHYGAPYLYSQELMVNDSCIPSFLIKPRIIPKISITTSHWTVHHTPSGYTDRDGWLKAMNQLSNICVASPEKKQILFLGGHYSHFNDRSLTQMQKNIQSFILKLVDYINDHLNDNGTIKKLKALYNTPKAKCMMKYDTSRFQPHHMNSVLFETW